MEKLRAEIRNDVAPSRRIMRYAGVGLGAVGLALSLAAVGFRLAGYGASLNRLVQVGAIGAPLTLTTVGGVIAWQYSKRTADEKIVEFLVLTPIDEWRETGDLSRITGERLQPPEGFSEMDYQITLALGICLVPGESTDSDATDYLRGRALQLLDKDYNVAIWQLSNGTDTCGQWIAKEVKREQVESLDAQTDLQKHNKAFLLDLFPKEQG